MENLFEQLIEAIVNNDEFNYSEDGLNVTLTENGLKITYSNEVQEFKDYLNALDDDLFLEICEYLGAEEISEISNLIDSDTREAAKRFNHALKEVLLGKLDA